MKILRKIDFKSVDAAQQRRRYQIRAFPKVFVAFAAFVPSPVFACAACYGKSDSALASGMNWGILTLLGVVLTVLTCIALFFVHIVRKEEAMSNPPPTADRPADL
jgi:heme/copper-type cytochrome/quinol oxidase subunit 2